MVSKKNPLAFGDMRATQVHTISPSYNSKVSYSLWHYGTNILTVMQPVWPGIDHIKAVSNYNQYHIINFISLSPRSKSNQFNPYWHNFDHISSKCLESATILDKVDMTLALIAEAQFSIYVYWTLPDILASKAKSLYTMVKENFMMVTQWF